MECPGEWGKTRYGRDKVELVLTRVSVERVEKLLESIQGS